MEKNILGDCPLALASSPFSPDSPFTVSPLPTYLLLLKSLQLCPTLCDPIDGSPPGLPIPGILQARTLVWVALSFSNVWNWKVKVKSLSRVLLLATPWTAAYLAPPSMGFSRQEYWSGVPLPSPTYLPTYFWFSPSTLKRIIPPSPQFLANQACWSALLSSCISGLIHFCISLERKVSKCTRR